MSNDEDWDALLSYLPPGWEEEASRSGALTRLRGFASPEDLLRVLLIHLAQGYSLRETAVRARRARIAEVSDVAVLKRLRNSEAWLHWLCRGLCLAAVDVPEAMARPARRFVAVDGTCISEPGSRGTDWRLHYALALPSLDCLHFELTDAGGAERFDRFPFRPGDLALGDRAYATVPGIRGVLARGADVLARVKVGQHNFHRGGARFDFLDAAEDLAVGQAREWEGELAGTGGGRVAGRLCLVRRPEEIAEMERAKIRRDARKRGHATRERTLRAAAFVGLFTTLKPGIYTTAELFEIYRFRWQVETAFKRLKSISSFGHLPKQDPASCRAWLYGKLLVGLLAERMSRATFFP